VLSPSLSLPDDTETQSQSQPSAPPNTLEYEDEDSLDSRSVWQPMATALAFFTLHRFAQRQQNDWIVAEYGNWGERLLYRLTRTSTQFAGSKRKRQ